MVRTSTLGRSLAAVLALASDVLAKDWESPAYTALYQLELPIPPVKQEKWPDRPMINPVTGKKVRYYEVDIKEFEEQVYPGKKKAKLTGYDGISPGMTFIEERGTESMVRFINNGKGNSSVHLHGSYSRAPFDGWAEDVTGPGEYKDYYYPNAQSGRLMWYHDHAIDHTAENAYFGLAGAWIVKDPAEDALGLPSGYGKYDIPLILASKQYNSDGTLYSPANEDDSLYGDVIQVNGKPWPFMKVEARKYRFRFLNAAISRTFFLYLEASSKPGTKIEFNVIGSDAGLLTGPQKTSDLYISMAERFEVVVDFAPFKGQNVTLRNTRDFAPDKDYLHTDKVMRFVVENKVVTDDSRVPATLRTVDFPAPRPAGTVDRKFLFHRQGSDWRINGVVFADVANRVLARPKRGSIEVWELENSSGGGWSHPIHIHLVDFRVIKRTGGKRGAKVFNYESAGLKDVVWLGAGETVTVEAHYAPWPGLYMFHCHNLIHEDHEMMAAFNVTQITDLGYPETDFDDPMDPAYRAMKVQGDSHTYDKVNARLQELGRLIPYSDVKGAEKALEDYYRTKKEDSTTSTPTSTSASSTSSPAAAVVTPTKPVTTPATTPKPSSVKTTSTSSKKTTTTKKKRDVRAHGRDIALPTPPPS